MSVQKKFGNDRECSFEAAESEARLCGEVSSSTVMLYASQAVGNFDGNYISENITAIMGYTVQEFLSPNFWADHIHPEDAPSVFNNLPRLFEHHQHHDEYRFLFKDGTYHWMFDELKLICDDAGNPKEIMGTWTDITDRKLAEEKLTNHLQAKEILIKEVQHRIKNNFQSLESLIALQMNKTKNTEVIKALQDAVSRVKSMRVLYERLLLTEDGKEISAKGYFESLCDTIISVFTGDVEIILEKDVDDFKLDTNKLITLGIIVNELLTNTMKYAFTNRASGIIKISVKQNDNRIMLSVQDNGNGLPSGFDITKSKGLGLMLVKMLSQQLQANLAVENHSGTRISLEFNV